MIGQITSLSARRLAQATRYFEAGRFARAARVCEKILQDEPGDVSALALLGSARFQEGDRESGLSILYRALAENPDDATLLANLGLLIAHTGNYPEAIVHLRRAVSLAPAKSELTIKLADTLALAGESSEAADLYRRALDHDPSDLAVRLSLANCLKDLGDAQSATRELERATQIDPHNPAAAGLLAEWYEQLNRPEDAEALAAKGLQAWPRDPRLTLVAARCLRRAGKLAEALKILDAQTDVAMSAGDRMALQYTRGRLLDLLNQPAEAMRALTEANALAARDWRSRNPEPNAYARNVADLRSAYTPALVADFPRPSGPPPDSFPVFLVGFPRSGTTLLQQLLSSHPNVQVMEERGVIAVLQHELASRQPFPQVLATLSEDQVELLRKRYFDLTAQQLSLNPDKLLVDKLPLNLVNAGLIYRIFPGAKFIFAERHPADVCLSCFMQNFSRTEAMANFFELGATVKFYSSVMALWARYRELLPLPLHVVRYENLVGDLRTEATALLKFLGLDWQETMTDFYKQANAGGRINTPSYDQVSQPLYEHARFRWHRYRAALEPHLPELGPWIASLGYTQAN